MSDTLYDSYLILCSEVGWSPLGPPEYASLRDYLVRPRLDWKKRKDTRDEKPDAKAVRAVGLFVGELRPDGSVGPVRDQTDTNYSGSVHQLTARLCKVCKNLLPISRFGITKHKNRKSPSYRSVCRQCDNKARQARRERV